MQIHMLTRCLTKLIISFLIASKLIADEKVGLSVDANNFISIIREPNSDTAATKIMVENLNIDCKEYNKLGDEELEVELFRLRNMNAVEIPIKSLPLYAAIKLCAESAGMNYIAPDKDDFPDLISLNVHAPAYELLELLAETYSFKLEYKSGIWRFYRINVNELITCCYQLRHNTNEIVTTNSPSINFSLYKNTQSANQTPNQSVFEKQKHELSELIQRILDMPSTDLEAQISYPIDVNIPQKVIEPKFVPKASTTSPLIKGNFFFSSDSNILTVTATRQQHSLIFAYLKTIDKPQKLIKIQSLIVETSKNPKKDFGIDWAKAGKAELSLQNIKNSHNKISDIAKSFFMPDIATLSVKDMCIALNFLQSDNSSTILQDPVVVTSNNREVALKSVTQQPIEMGNSSSTTATVSSISNSIGYIEIGTLINIYPKIIDGGIEGYDDEAVKMDISIVISSQSGIHEIDGNTYPIVSSRTYTYSVIVPSGYTLAIGGLSESAEHVTQNKLPMFGDIPGFGWLFRSKHKSNDKRNLLAFITPTIIGNKSNSDLAKTYPSNSISSFDILKKIKTEI